MLGSLVQAIGMSGGQIVLNVRFATDAAENASYIAHALASPSN